MEKPPLTVCIFKSSICGEIPVDFPIAVLCYSMGGEGPAAGNIPKDSGPCLAAHAAEHTGYDTVVGFQGVYFPRFRGDALSDHEISPSAIAPSPTMW